MPQSLWCWRCQRDVPMLTESEFQRVWGELAAEHPNSGDLDQGLRILESRIDPERFQTVVDSYEAITGVREIDVRTLLHHRVDLYGPPCAQCGRALRTSTASQCVECGHSPGSADQEVSR